MNKTNRIRLFFLSTAIVGIISFRTAYFYTTENDDSRESALVSTERINTSAIADADSKSETGKIQKDTEEIVESMNEKEPYLYLIGEADGYLVIYEADGTTVYLQTEIETKYLATELQNEVSEGKMIYSPEELYSFLENYSS